MTPQDVKDEIDKIKHDIYGYNTYPTFNGKHMKMFDVLLEENAQLEHVVEYQGEFLKMDLINKQHKEWEFRLFKRSVREFVDEGTYKKIGDTYNQRVTEFRKTGVREIIKEMN